MADDKVSQLVEKLMLTRTTEFEAAIRAELKPLLDIAEAATGVLAEDDRSEILLERLAAELRNWRKE